MIELALATGISPREWTNEGARAIVTAIDLIEERSKPAESAPESTRDGIQYSG